MTHIEVIKRDTTGTVQDTFGDMAGFKWLCRRNPGTEQLMVGGVANRGERTAAANTNVECRCYRYDGAGADNAARLKQRVNNVDVALTFVGTIPATFTMPGTCAIGHKSSSMVDGTIFTEIVYLSALSDANVDRVDALLRYALAGY